MVLDSRGLFFRKIRVISEIVSNSSPKDALEINFWLVLGLMRSLYLYRFRLEILVFDANVPKSR